jgi:hypothetical protein
MDLKELNFNNQPLEIQQQIIKAYQVHWFQEWKNKQLEQELSTIDYDLK